MAGGIIYCLTCRPTGKHYVGQTIGPLWRRWKQHRQAHRGWTNRALWAAIRKYGPAAFDRRVLERVDTIDRLNEREVYWAAVYNSIAPNGYNLKVGNGHAVVVTAETRVRLGEASRRDWATPEGRAKRMALIRFAHTPGAEAKRARSMRAAWAREGPESPRIEALRRALSRPETRARRSALQTPEVRARTAVLMRARWKEPAYRDQMLRVHADRKRKQPRDPATGKWTR